MSSFGLSPVPVTALHDVQRYIHRLRLHLIGELLLLISLGIILELQLAGYIDADTSFEFALLVHLLLIANITNGVLSLVVVFKAVGCSIQTHTETLRMFEERERRTLQFTIAAEIARDAARSDDLQSILSRTTQLVRKRFGYYHVGIFLLDPTGEYAQLRAADGPAGEQLLLQEHKLRVGKEGIVGYVTSIGEGRIAQNVEEDKVHYRNPILLGTRSEMAIPFRVGDQVIGAIDVQSIQANAFTEADIIILQSMADLLAVAIAKTKLNEEVNQYATTLEQRVERRTDELARERAQLRAVLDSMGEGVVYNELGETRYINRALARMCGLEEPKGATTFNFLDWQATLNTDFREETDSVESVILRDGIWRGEVTLIRTDRSTFEAGLTTTGVFDNMGKLTGVVTIIRDISQEKELQHQKMRFVANASHELRTPITNLKTRLYLIRRQPNKITEHLVVLDRVVSRMQYLVDNLLDLARFENGNIRLERQVVILQDLIQDVIEVQRVEADVKQILLEAELPEDPIYVSLDEGRMIQVLTNLMSNAINYTQENGAVFVRLKHDLDTVSISVQDTGIGIALEHLEHLFKPFYRVSHDSQGTGLGLNITKTIVELHGGTILVESTPGVGSTFTVYLLHENLKPAQV